MVQRLRGDQRGPEMAPPGHAHCSTESWALGPSLLQGHECGSVFHGEEKEGVCGTEAQMAAGVGSFLMDCLYYFFKIGMHRVKRKPQIA